MVWLTATLVAGVIVAVVAVIRNSDRTPRWARAFEDRLTNFIDKKVRTILMAMVELDQDVIDQLATDLGNVETALATEISNLQAAGNIPQANLDALNAVKDQLAGLEVPSTPTTPTT